MLGPNAERDARAIKWLPGGETPIYFEPDWTRHHIEEFAKLVHKVNPPPLGHRVNLVSLPADRRLARDEQEAIKYALRNSSRFVGGLAR